MLTKAQISTASNLLDETDIEMLATLFRMSKTYRQSPSVFPDLETRIEESDGTVKAQILNATLDLLEELGVGEVAISGGDEGLRYSQTTEREALVSYALSVLYNTAGVGTPDNLDSDYKVAQREVDLTVFI